MPLQARPGLKTKAGTPYYVAPEVLAGAYDEKSDMWSCGVIMFVLHCGYPPFFGESDAEVLKKVKAGKFEFSNADWNKVTKESKFLVTALLTKDPKARITARDALSSDWITKVAEKQTIDLGKDIVSTLRGYQGTSKLKKLALKAIAKQSGSQQIKDLVTAFKELDADGDGHLTVAELKKGLAKAGVPQPEIDAIYNAMDTDGNGKINYEEFISSTIEKRVKLEDAVLWETFKAFDKNGDGQITRKELKDVGENLEGADVNFDMALMNELMMADTNGDDKISFEEFKEAMTQGIPAPKK